MTCQGNTHGLANQINDGGRHKQMTASSPRKERSHSLGSELEEWEQQDTEHCTKKTDDLREGKGTHQLYLQPLETFPNQLSVGLNSGRIEVYCMKGMNEAKWCLFRCTEFRKPLDLLAAKANFCRLHKQRDTFAGGNKAQHWGAGLQAKFQYKWKWPV